nr:hypothetical protein [Tanacetum cinerariifolium]
GSSSSGNFFWQWEHITGSGKTALEVGMDRTFNSQQLPCLGLMRTSLKDILYLRNSLGDYAYVCLDGSMAWISKDLKTHVELMLFLQNRLGPL